MPPTEPFKFRYKPILPRRREVLDTWCLIGIGITTVPGAFGYPPAPTVGSLFRFCVVEGINPDKVAIDGYGYLGGYRLETDREFNRRTDRYNRRLASWNAWYSDNEHRMDDMMQVELDAIDREMDKLQSEFSTRLGTKKSAKLKRLQKTKKTVCKKYEKIRQ